MPSVQLSEEIVDYAIVRTKRRTVGVVVHEDGRVEVRAPKRATLGEISAVVAGFTDWIERQRVRQSRAGATCRRLEWADGETLPYLGQELTLRVRSERGLFPGSVWRAGESDLVVYAAPEPADGGRVDPEAARLRLRADVRAAVLGWLLEQASEIFHRCHVRAAARVGQSATRIRIKEMRTRWGSCGPSRRMSLNWRLVLAPEPVVEYVLVHELVHIEVPDHSARFWARVEAACPDYRTHRRWLRKHARRLDL
jgi:hypothetical protein